MLQLLQASVSNTGNSTMSIIFLEWVLERILFLSFTTLICLSGMSFKMYNNYKEKRGHHNSKPGNCMSSGTKIRIVGGWSPTGSTRHIGHQLAYCTCTGWLWEWRIWWNDDWRWKPKYSEKSCPSAILSTTNPTWPEWAWSRATAVGSHSGH
jgi:hypothetical protein